MKARYGALFALLMTVMVVGVLFASPASADGDYTVTVEVPGTSYVSPGSTTYTTSGGACNIVLNINDEGSEDGWYFRDGTSVGYTIGSGAENTYPVTGDQTSLTVPIAGISENCTVTFSVVSALSNHYDLTVSVAAEQKCSAAQTSYSVEYGDTQDVIINVTPGYEFTAGEDLVYSVTSSSGTSSGSHTITSEEKTSLTITTSEIESDTTLVITSAPTVKIDYEVKYTIPTTAQYTVTLTSSTPGHYYYGDTVHVKIDAKPGVEIGTGDIAIKINGTDTIVYTVSTAASSVEFDLSGTVEGNITLTFSSTSVPINEIQYTVTVVSGCNIGGKKSVYTARYGETVEITMVVDLNYYLLKGTKVRITQDSDDIYYTAVNDIHEFVISTGAIYGDSVVTVAELTDTTVSPEVPASAVRYYGVLENNGYGSTYIDSIGTQVAPTEFTKGRLIVTEDASGYVLMSAGSGDPISYYSTVLMTRTTAAGVTSLDNTYFVFSGAPSMVCLSSGDVAGITVYPGGSVDIMTLDGSLTMSYVNDTLSDMIFTYTSGSWAFYLDANAYKAFEKRITVNESSVINSKFLRFIKDVPTEITSLSNLELHLCTNTGSVSIDLGSYIDVYQGSSVTAAGVPVDGVLFETFSGTATISVNNGYITSANVSAGASVGSDGKVYRNADSSPSTFTFTAGNIAGGYDCRLESSFDGSTIYYTKIEDAVQNSRSGDAITLDTSYSGTFDIIQGVMIYNSDGTGPVCVTSGSASVTASSGMVSSVKFTSKGVLDLPSIAVSIVNKDSSDVTVHISGVSVTSVDAGGSTAVSFQTVADQGSSSGSSFTVVNEMGGSIELLNSGSNVLVKEGTGDFVTLTRGTQVTVYSSGTNTDAAIAAAVPGDHIEIFGKASTTGDRYASMTASGKSAVTVDWSFLKVLPAGVYIKEASENEWSVYGANKYIHIENGELFVVKYYGADHPTSNNYARWIYYESDLLYKCGVTYSTSFNYDTLYYFNETPGDTRGTPVGGSGTGAALRIMEGVRVLETHNGYFGSEHAFDPGYQASSTSPVSERGVYLTKVTLENSYWIQDYQFRNCTNLESVSFTITNPQNVNVGIDTYAFYGCYNLKEIYCPDVSIVAHHAFYGCTSLREFVCDGDNYNSSSWYISYNAFQDCTSLERVVHLTATYTDSNSFRGCTSLKEVEIPEVKTIYGSSFYNCSSLEYVNMESVVTISSWAFYMCSSLGDLYMPNVTSISNDVFRGSSTGDGISRVYTGSIAAKNVYMPNIKTIESTAFAGCENLETVTATSLETIGTYAFHKCSSLKSFYAPNLATASATYVFEGCTSMTSFHAPKITQVSSYFFFGCENLRTVDLDSVKTVGSQAFGRCYSLEYIYLPSADTISACAFIYTVTSSGTTLTVSGACTSLKSAYLPNVTTINYRAFAGCTALESVYCPLLASIAYTSASDTTSYAFFGCTSLKTFEAPQLKTLGSYAFTKCTALESVSMPTFGNRIAPYSFFGCTSLKYVDIRSVMTIGNNSFQGCTELITVNMSKCATVETNAFYNCEKLTAIDLPSAETINNYAFYNCKAAATANLPKALTLGEYAFAKTSSLATVNMPSVTALYAYCFSESGIEHVNIGTDATKYDQTPEMVTPIIFRGYVFTKCTNLQDITIGTAYNVKIDTHDNNTDYQYQFNACSALEHVTIGTITWMPYRMFNNCMNLLSCTVGTADVVMYQCFYGASNMTSLSIGKVNTQIGASSAYYSAYSLGCTGLGTLTLGDVGTIYPYAFYEFKSLSSITMGDVNGIGSYAFTNATALSQVTAGNVGAIGRNAFAGCGMTDISITSASDVGLYCFSGCTSLVHFNTAEDGLLNLSDIVLTDSSGYAFQGCTSLTNATLGDQTICIAQYCFSGCNNLKTITAKNVTTVKASAFNGTILNSIILNEDTSASVFVGTYSNYPLWIYAHTVKIGGFVVTSGSSQGKNKTLTLTNCTIDTHSYDRNYIMAMSATESGKSYSTDVGFKYLYINSNVTVDEQAFANTGPLETVTVNEGATNVTIGIKAFYNTSKLTTVVFNTNIAVTEKMFYTCTSLVNVYGGQYITSVGVDAFLCCYKLQNIFDGTGAGAYNPEGSTGRIISIPNATYIDDYGLYLCRSRSSVSSYYTSLTDGGLITEVYAPKVTKLGEGAVMSSNLTKITVGALTELHTTSFGHTLEPTIGTYVFYPSINLNTFICESYKDTDGSETAVDKIRTDMFNLSYSVRNVYINNLGITGTMSIGDQFKNDLNLQTLIIGKVTLTVNEGFIASGLKTLTVVGNANFKNSAFKNCTSLTSVTMTGSCKPTFGTFCFDGCTNLQSFTADSTASPVLSADLFNGCTKLSTFTVNGLTALPDRLFNGCVNLKKINSDKDGEAILNSVTSVGDTPFSGMTIKYMQLNGMTHITSEIFTGMTSIEELSINGATQIDDDALEGFTQLRILNIDGMDTISKDFINNDNNNNTVLQKISILGAVEIQPSAFQGCSNLNTVSLNTTAGDGIITIYANAFKNCGKLTAIELTCVKYVYESAFSDSGIMKVTMPYAKQVKEKAFYNCTGLTTVSISGCFSFGTSCFSCDYDAGTNTGKRSGLQSIKIDGVDGAILGDYMFKSCLSLSMINSTTAGTANLSVVGSIGTGTFSGCSNIKTVNIPAGLSNIGNYSFDGCTSLKTVETASGSDVTIGNYAFRNCVALFTLSFEMVTSIGDYSFQNCSKLYSLTMPNLITMGKSSFSGCSALHDIDMSSLTGVTSSAFSGCTKLEKVVMNSLRTIGDYAFDGCTSLKEFGNMGEKTLDLSKVTSVGEYAFRNVSSEQGLENPISIINFGVYITQIGNYAFYGMKFITDVILPESLENIGAHAFDADEHYGSYKIISIPSSIKTIGEYAFGTTNSLSIYLNGDFTADGVTISKNAFFSYNDITVYLWKEKCDVDTSSFIVSNRGEENVTKVGEYHTSVWFSSLDTKYSKVTYTSVKIMNDGYIVLPYGENGDLGKDTKVLYFGISTNPDNTPTLALLNTAGDHDSVAKSGDYFRPVVNYTTATDVSPFYFAGVTIPGDAGGGVSLIGEMDGGIVVSGGVTFDSKTYWYRDTVVLPTFNDDNYTKSTVYGYNAITDYDSGGEPIHAVYYDVDDEEKKKVTSIVLGYIESKFVITVKKFAADVIWEDESGIVSTKKDFGDPIGTLREASSKTAYHFLWWSTVKGSLDEANKIDETYVIKKTETYLYAIYTPNTYYVNVKCTTPSAIAGYVSDEPFSMSGNFRFTIYPDGRITYTDKNHLTETLMFDAGEWRTGYDFSQYAYNGQLITEAYSVDFNEDIPNERVFEVTLMMVEHTYSVKLQYFTSEGVQLESSPIELDSFRGTQYTYAVVGKESVTGIYYSDLALDVTVTTPIYVSDSEHPVRYTYNNKAVFVWDGIAGKDLSKDASGNLYINYDSFKNSAGVYVDAITIRYYFIEGMYNIKYSYDDDTKSTYTNPSTVKGITGTVYIDGIGDKVKTGYSFDKWVLLDANGKETSYTYPIGGTMPLTQEIIDNADASNTLTLKGLWTAKEVWVEFDFNGYSTEPIDRMKVSTGGSITLPTETSADINRPGYSMIGWKLEKDGSDVMSDKFYLTQSIYGSYVTEGTTENTLKLYAHWSVKTYTFAVSHSGSEAPPSNRYTTEYSYTYLTETITLWEADKIDATEQFKTLIGWNNSDLKYKGETKNFNVGTNNLDEEMWLTIAAYAKEHGSNTILMDRVWEDMTFLLYFDTDDGGYITQGPNPIGPKVVGTGEESKFEVYDGTDLKKLGYTFKGWYCGTDTINLYKSGEVYYLSASMASMADKGTLTFTAVWVEVTYSIDYELDGGVPSGVLPRTARYMTSISIDYPTKEGYEFAGWESSDITQETAQYKNDDNWSLWDGSAIVNKQFRCLTYETNTVKMVATWNPTIYTIIYDKNGGSGTIGSGDTSGQVGESLTLPKLLEHEKTGYEYQGWSIDKVNVYDNSSGIFTSELAEAADESNRLYFYALWTPITYTIYYNYDGSNDDTSKAPEYASMIVKYDTPVKIDYLEKIGYIFKGWSSDDVDSSTAKYSTTGEDGSWVSWNPLLGYADGPYFMNLACTQDAKVHIDATYTKIEYTVKYDSNGGSGTAPVDEGKYTIGSEFEFQDHESLKGTNGDKSVIGWSTDRDATSAMTASKFNETIASAADSNDCVTFYAVWIENGCLIKVNLDGGSPSSIPSGWKKQDDTGYYVRQVDFGSSIKDVMADWDNISITKEGYVFSSWEYSGTVAMADVEVTSNYEKVENNLLYIFIGVFAAIVVAIIIIARIEH